MKIEKIFEEVRQNRFSMHTRIDPGDGAMQVRVDGDWTVVSDSGTLGIFSGKQKSRKTFIMSCFVASALKGEAVGEFHLKFKDGEHILWIDTEQMKNRFLTVQRRIFEMAEIYDDLPNYEAISLKRYSAGERMGVIAMILDEYARENKKIGLIVIDGIADICENFMDNGSSKETVNQISAWQDIFQCQIWCAIHVNKSDHNIRGFLGTELQNKCDFHVQIVKEKDIDTHSTVHCKDSRYNSFHPFRVEQARDGKLDIPFQGMNFRDDYPTPVKNNFDITQQLPAGTRLLTTSEQQDF